MVLDGHGFVDNFFNCYYVHMETIDIACMLAQAIHLVAAQELVGFVEIWY